MHLKKIKLAGFKSFVDPTSVPLPGRLVGIVGPNGCGKSNLIDAVRWVMGESSAKHLRGESMADVIFNGSSERAPVGQASIELVFDNTDGTVGGKYAGFNEISIKRQVNREGQSHYALNGTRCRRRDISDVFMGTGLRPRGYTIIEQGMISRVIESRPEELRVYLEEAAGISVYKERRRETERRMTGTRENLERLNDVRDEVGRQLERLRRQAETAERYRELKDEERRLRAELTVLRMQALDAHRLERESHLAEREKAREAAVAGQRRAEREMEALREASADRHEKLNAIQGRYYQVGSQIASLEQRIQHEREMRQRRGEELEQVGASLAELEETVTEDREKLAVLEARLDELEPAHEAAVAEEEAAGAAHEEARGRLDAWRDAVEQARTEQQAAGRREEVERLRGEAAARRVREMDERIKAVDDEYQTIDPQALEREIEELEAEDETLAAELEAGRQARDAAGAAVEEGAGCRDRASRALDEAREGLAGARARLTSLETLQESALGRQRGEEREEWLSRHGWDGAPRLAEGLDVTPGWERAVEAVLGDSLQAVCVADATLPAGGWPEGGSLILAGDGGGLDEPSGDRLASRVRGYAAAREMLMGVRCAASLPEAYRLRAELGPGQSVVTPEGVWMGRHWLRTPGGDEAEAGLLEREREIASLREEIGEAERWVAQLEGELEAAREAVAAAERRRDEAAARLEPLHRRHADLQARLQHRREALESARGRRDELAATRERLREQRAEAVTEQEEAAMAAEGAAEAVAAAAERLEAVEVEREGLQRRVDDGAERLHAARERRHELVTKRESARTGADSVREQLRRAEVQYERLRRRHDELREAEKESGDPAETLAGERDALLADRAEIETELAEARRQAESLDHQFRQWEAHRVEAERLAESEREQAEQLRLEVSELNVHRQREGERLHELELTEEAVAGRLPEGAAADEWERSLEATVERVRRLGSVNLAAIDECRQLEERQHYLDAQFDDLSEALETLEGAIRRIDRETRARFRDTFEQVNQGLSRFFPRLFGGGRAYLELTEDDLLSTGVTVMAQPPGKRISSIHLLSGGEKALTAVALVFAIFNLNPAPFCLLDEVDAPLDEANVGRFCGLVEEMSEKVQFVLITHNKTTMERASHLLGVTMHEPGVSRLVAVDVDEAMDIAEAG